jgi:NAD(P)-dependent dehydrogenase (short-subunit alcohol dehydrogenase family)
VITGRREEVLAASAETLRAAAAGDAQVAIAPGDVSDEDQVVAAVAIASELPGRLAIAVASAGDGTLGPVTGTSGAEWQRVLDVSLTGVFNVFKHAGAAMSDGGGGSLVAVSSIAGKVTHRHMGPYSVAKAGVDMLTRNTADELGAVGVRVNSVNPGIIKTDLVAMIDEADDVGQSYMRNMPIARFGEVADVAAAIRFLAGPESSFITGVNLSVDGGQHLRCGPDYSTIAKAMYSGVVPDEILES